MGNRKIGVNNFLNENKAFRQIKHKYLIEIFEFAMSHDEDGEFETVIIISFL
jgi:hypothetical protein